MPPISAVTLSQHDLAAAYVLDALDADERIAFEEHLSRLRDLPGRSRIAAKGRRFPA